MAVGEARDYDAAPACAGPVQAGSHYCEDCQAAAVADDLFQYQSPSLGRIERVMQLTSGGILSNFLSFLSACPCLPSCCAWKPSIQKLRRMRAALSDSLSKDVGQKASAPSLFAVLLTGTPTLSNHFLLFCFVFSQVEDLDALVEVIVDW